MIIEVKVPQLSESVSEATLLTWNKSVGDMVVRDENLIDVETDKVVLELPAPANGKLVSILKKQGDQVTSNEIIATIDTDAVADKESVSVKKDTSVDVKPEASKETQTVSQSNQVAMPSAKKLIAENNLDIKQIEGSGRGGRVTKSDVVSQLTQNKSISAPTQTANLTGDRLEQRVPMSRLRARVAERLVESQSTAAILTTFNEVNMQLASSVRSSIRVDTYQSGICSLRCGAMG